MPKRAIIRCVFDSNIERMEVCTDTSFNEVPPKAEISNAEIATDFQDSLFVRVVVYPDYELDVVECNDYSLAFRSAWSIEKVEKTDCDNAWIVTLQNKGTESSDNCVVSVTTKKKVKAEEVEVPEKPTTEKSCSERAVYEPTKITVGENNKGVIDLTKLPKWNELPSGEYTVTIRAKGKNASGENRKVIVVKP